MVVNIYDKKAYFQLTIVDQIYDIAEPIEWSNATLHMPRDKFFYGFNADYIDDKVQVVFMPDDGGDLIRDAYLNIGVDCAVYFEFGIYDYQVKKSLYRGSVYTGEYSRTQVGVKATIEKMPFQAKLASRFGTPVTVNGFLNFDKFRLGKIPTWNLRLHSKTLYKQSTFQSTEVYLDSIRFTNATASDVFIQPDTNSQILSELMVATNMPYGLIEGGDNKPNNDPGDPAKSTTSLYQYKAIEAGLLNVAFSGEMQMYFFQNAAGFYEVSPRIRVQRSVSNVDTIVYDNILPQTKFDVGFTPGLPANGITPIPSNIFDGSDPNNIIITGSNRNAIRGFNYSWNVLVEGINIEVNDKIYVGIYCNIDTNNAGIFFTLVSNYTNNLALQQYTVDPSSYCQSYRIFDVLTHCLECCTGFTNRLKSTFFSQGGRGYNYMLANGFSIRNFLGDSYSMKVVTQDLINDLQAIFNIGVGYQTDNAGNDYMVIEEMPFFFQDKMILFIKNSSNWEDRHDPNFFYNEAELGFNKYAQNELYLLDEYCTEASFLFTATTVQNILQKKSGLIGSGYTTEIQRRSQFLQNPNSSLINDNDIFIIACEDTTTFQTTTMIFGDPSVSYVFAIQATLNMIVGDRFTVSGTGTANDGIVFSVTTVAPHSGGYDHYLVYPAPTAAFITPPTGKLTLVPINSSYKFAERNENFAVLSNVIDPPSVYNARLTVKHILYNWSPLLATSLYWAKAPDTIVTTFAKNNNLVTTQFVSTDPNKGYIGNRVVTEIDNIAVSDYNQGQAVFTPQSATFDCKLSGDQAILLRSALRGEATDDVNYGYIVAPDDYGQYWKLWVLDFKYNPTTQMTSFDVNKKEKYYPISNTFVE